MKTSAFIVVVGLLMATSSYNKEEVALVKHIFPFTYKVFDQCNDYRLAQRFGAV